MVVPGKAMAKKESALKVRIPTRAEDRPVLSRVGIVAVLGFAAGIAWPKLLGAKLGPDVPGGSRGPEPTAPADVAPAPGASARSAPEDEPAPAAEEAKGVTNKQRALVESVTVKGCKDKKGKRVDDASECGPLDMKKAIEAKLHDLGSCPEVIGLGGTMGLELEIDFEKKSVRVDGGDPKREDGGKVPSSTTRGILVCAAEELGSLELDHVAHTMPRYGLVANLRFVPPGQSVEPASEGGAKKPGDDKGEGKPAEGGDGKGATGLGSATVSWEKALLRDSPKDGKVVARVPQGGRVDVLEQRDDWYLVEKGGKKGWVYRQAIGK